MTSVITPPPAVAGRRRSRSQLRGRPVESEALAEIQQLLADSPPQRDLLLEYLHDLNDHVGYLTLRHLRALAEWMRLPMAEVYETATFYAHFTLVRDGETPPAALTVRVCDSLSCQLAGAETLRAGLAEGLDPAEVRVVRAPCMGRCDSAPVAEVGHYHLGQASVAGVKAAIAAGHVHADPATSLDYPSLEAYRAMGGYGLLDALRAGEVAIDDLAKMIEQAGLRGLGGAGFPTFRKWGFVRAEAGPRYCVINADEGEPGTFKDRYHLEREPHTFLEGALASAHVIDAEGLYIYLRDEYPTLGLALRECITELEVAGVVASGFIHLRRGAGAYICGEESALIESLEGKPGKPRQRPPFVAQCGLFGRPTLVNNVETVYWIARLHREGIESYVNVGRHGRQGLRSFSLSGRVMRPGMYLAPAGITLNELVEEYGGGMAAGHRLLAYLPAGLPAEFCRPARPIFRWISTPCRRMAASSARRR
ncbi:NAD(P)H-dependent oxidoreductase subunit E [Cobetia crustatorum]|uniref:NAD(P)H-dependent oxidoreductase subunit E n=1 Tax=Cobetia crustatorum TaxID=553385 RepID=UPI0004BB868E|nr:NAD(P)H-dependent oxidoreductase subunit E [Cobetia crustatorum]